MGIRRWIRRARRSVPRRSGVRLRIRESTNDVWWKSDRGQTLTVQRRPIITRDTRVFTLGSCFAVEIRKALRQRGVDVYPKYLDVPIDPNTELIGKLPARDNVNHYDTFNIRQEFDRIWYSEAPYQPLELGADVPRQLINGKARFQDPYRRDVLAVDQASMEQVNAKLSRCIREAVEAADVYVITLGLIESWRDRVVGNYVWSERVRSRSADPERFRFELTDFQRNYENMRWVCDELRERHPNKPIVLTVSPVPLGRTFTGNDVVAANSYSKAVLRSVAGQLSAELDNVLYWPSYEIASRMDVFGPDGRHVTDQAVGFIVDHFLGAHAALGHGGQAR